MFELMDAYSQSAVIKVIGVGGGGGNAVAHMVTAGIDGVEFMCINTDSQALKHAKVKTALQIGCNITDRKSTRLNSSHSQISYAVFCLKKKKKKKESTRPPTTDIVVLDYP